MTRLHIKNNVGKSPVFVYMCMCNKCLNIIMDVKFRLQCHFVNLLLSPVRNILLQPLLKNLYYDFVSVVFFFIHTF